MPPLNPVTCPDSHPPILWLLQSANLLALAYNVKEKLTCCHNAFLYTVTASSADILEADLARNAMAKSEKYWIERGEAVARTPVQQLPMLWGKSHGRGVETRHPAARRSPYLLEDPSLPTF